MLGKPRADQAKAVACACRLSSPLEVGAQPLETLVETVTAGGAGGLDEPLSLSQAVQAELVRDLGSVHRVGQILLVGEDEQQGIAQLVLVEHALKLLARLGHTLAVVGVDDEDDAVGVLEVCKVGERLGSATMHAGRSSEGKQVQLTVPPEGSDLVLSSDVPHGERDVLVFDGLDVEACECGAAAQCHA